MIGLGETTYINLLCIYTLEQLYCAVIFLYLLLLLPLFCIVATL